MNRFELHGTLSHVTKLPMKDDTKHGARFMVAVPKGKAGGFSTLPCVAWDNAATAVLALEDGAAAVVKGHLQRRSYNNAWETQLVADDVKPGAASDDDSPF